MPIYEYRCQDCGAAFEALVRSGEQVRCKGCESERLEKLFSTFAVSSGQGQGQGMPAAAAEPGPCGRCGAAKQGMCQN